MKDFSGKFAVITGGGTGMGRELAIQLAAEGCNVAMCDVSAVNMAVTKQLCAEQGTQGTRVSTYVADVSVEDQILAWATAVRRELDTDRIQLLINNAGIGGGGSECLVKFSRNRGNCWCAVGGAFGWAHRAESL